MLSITLFVDDGAASGGDGLAWETAYDDLQSALTEAYTRNNDADGTNDVGEVWIAEGTYLPGTTGLSTFELVDEVAIYGGFEGTEATLAERDLSAGHTTILSGDISAFGGSVDNVSTVIYCDEDIEATIDGVVITDGVSSIDKYNAMNPSASCGGGVYCLGDLTLANSVVSNCVAQFGGGIYNNGTMEIVGSSIEQNTGKHGGGVLNYGTLQITGSSIWDNTGRTVGGVPGAGAGIFSTSELAILNSTIAENSAQGLGGGIHNRGPLDVVNSTISGNSGADGGGVFAETASSEVTLHNTLIFGNETLLNIGVDVSISAGALTGSCNLIGDIGGDSILEDGVDGNMIDVDPLLSQLSQFGNGLRGYSLLDDSPALNAGDNALALDASGAPLTEDMIGNNRILGDTVDIGAVEGVVPLGTTYVVTSLENSTASDGVLTFLEAFQAASTNQAVGDAPAGSAIEVDLIRFADGLSGTVSITSQLVLEDSLVIEGPGEDLLTFNGNNQSRIFFLAPSSALILSGVTLTAGSEVYGGAIYGNEMDLEIFDSTISYCSGITDGGGGIYNYAGTVSLDGVTFSNNTGVAGGGIYSYGDLSVINSTFSENAASGTVEVSHGGAICVQSSSAYVSGSTFSGNSATGFGGAIDVYGGTATIVESWFSGNSSTYGAAVDCYASTVDVTSSTVMGNTASGYGGGFSVSEGGMLTVSNSTITDNSAYNYGGGIFNGSGNLVVTNSTIFENSTIDTSGNGLGGGILMLGSTAVTTLNNTLVAENKSSYAADIYHDAGTLSASHTLIGKGTGQSSIRNGVNGNQVGSTYYPIDPMLGDLMEFANGMWGYCPLEDSPAIDAGDDALALDPDGNALVTDISGDDRVIGGTVDIGAVEAPDYDPPAQTYVVTSLGNAIADDGVLTFFEALQAANTNTKVGDAPAGSFKRQDIIQFADGLNGTVLVNSGELSISDDLMINGPGAELIAFDAEGQNRVFNIEMGVDVYLGGITITGGFTGSDGGGIYSSGSLTLADSVISNNEAYKGGGIYSRFFTTVIVRSEFLNNDAKQGGGIFSQSTMTITASVISGNECHGEVSIGLGAGIFNDGTLAIEDSVISGNAVNSGMGGGFFNNGASGTVRLTITNCSIIGNSSHNGAGVYNYMNNGASNLIITNSTISGNTAETNGGGIYNSDSLKVTNCTITENSAEKGGGIFNTTSYANATLNNTIVAGNSADENGPDIHLYGGTLSGSYCLIGDGTDQTGLADGVDGNQVGSSSLPIDPKLGELTQFANGQWGHNLLDGSVAINVGNNDLAVDPDGQTLTADIAGNDRILYGVVDIGAVEATEISAQTYVVTSLENTIAQDGILTFIEAFQAANTNVAVGDAPAGSGSEQDVIYFDDDLMGTLMVISGQLTVEDDLHIECSTLGNVEFDASGNNRIFEIQEGVFVDLYGIVISHGSDRGDNGGGILNSGTLTITNCTVANSFAYSDGGGIYNSGMLTITDSTILGNQVSDSYDKGGGIYNAGVLTVINSTFSDNKSRGDGGGIYNHSTLQIADCTFSDNTANSDGGGIYNSGTLNVSTSVFRDGLAGGDGGGIYNSGTVTVMSSAVFGNLVSGSYGCGGGIYNDGNLTVTNSVFTKNSTDYAGGAIYNEGTLKVTNSTLSGNSADYGSGICSYDSDATVTLYNTIVTDGIYDEYNKVTGSYNLVRSCSTLTDGVDGNIVGYSDPVLSPWTQLENGVWGFYILAGTPVIDAGNNALAVDASGQPLTEDLAGNARIVDGTVNMGAVESIAPDTPAQTYLVTSLEEVIANDGVLTFIEAFQAANTNQPCGDAPAGSIFERDTIQFADTLSGTILVDDGQLTLYGDLAIEGNESRSITFDADGQNRVFLVEPDISVSLSGITITGGMTQAAGGGIYNSGDLTVTNCDFSDNQASGGGGGIMNHGALVVTDSRFSNNTSGYLGGGICNYYYYGSVMITGCSFLDGSAEDGGGGIYNSLGTLYITDCLFSGNSAKDGGGVYSYDRLVALNCSFLGNASDNRGGGIYTSLTSLSVANCVFSGNSSKDGGGIYSRGSIVTNNSTFLGNSASASGGGIHGENSISLKNTILAGNTADVEGPEVFGDSGRISGSHSLIGDGTGQTDLVHGVDGNLVGSASSPIDPKLGELTQFANGLWGYIPLPGSPVIDAGDNGLAVGYLGDPLLYDIAGNDRIRNEIVDIGAYEAYSYDIIVDAGGPYETNEGSAVLLHVSASSEGTYELIFYEWDLDGDGDYDDATGEDISFATTEDGDYTVRVKVSDSNGFFGVGEAVVTVLNLAPTPVVASPSPGMEGEAVTLDASGSTDPGDDIVLYGWDLDNDGQYDDATGVTVQFSGTNSGEYTVGLKVTDDDGATSTDSVTVTIENVAPTADVGGPYVGFEGEMITLDASGSTDPGEDVVSYLWDLDNDGEYDDASGVTASFECTIAGDYTVAVKVIDDDGAWDVDLTTVQVTPIPPEASLVSEAAIGVSDVVISVIYSDNIAISVASIGSGDILVTGTNGYSQYATLVSVDSTTDGTPLGATYRVTSPGLQWFDSDNGSYQVTMVADQVYDTTNVAVPEGTLGTFTIALSNLPPTADADGPYAMDEGQSVTLDASSSTDLDGTIVSYAWDFDNDGQYDDATGVTADFSTTEDGVYTVGLKVTDEDGAISTDSVTVTVSNVAPTADAGGPYAGVEGDVIALDASGSTDPGADIVSYEWDLDNDGEYDDASDVTVNFEEAASGVYTVGLKVTDDDGATSTDSVTVTVGNVAPTADIGGPYAGEEGASITLDASGSSDPGNDIVSYLWDLDNDGEYDDASGTTADFGCVLAGDYTVAVKVTDDDGAWDVDSVVVHVDSLPPEAELTGDVTTGVSDATFAVTYSDNISIAVELISDGDILVVGPNGYIQHATLLSLDVNTDGTPRVATYCVTSPGQQWLDSDNGTYQIWMVAEEVYDVTDAPVPGGVLGSFVITLGNLPPTAEAGGDYVTNEGQAVTLNAASSTDLDGTIVSYLWDLDNDGQYDDASGATASFSTTEDGVYTVSVQVTDDDGVASTDSATVTVGNVAPTADIGGPYAVDEGSSVTLFALGSSDPGNDIALYEWDFDNDGEYDDATGLAVGFSSTDHGLYTVGLKVTDNDGASSTDSVVVTVNNVAPTAEAGGPYEGDQGTTITLDASNSFDPADDIVAYAWDLDGDGEYDDAAGVTVDFSFTEIGNHVVGLRVTDDDGATGTDTATVTVNNLPPTVNLGGPYTVDEGSSVTLDASASHDQGGTIVSYAWDLDGDGKYDDAFGATVSFSSTEDGEHVVAVKVIDNDEASIAASTTVTVLNVAPTAEAGGPYTVNQGQTVPLWGSGSSDPADDIVAYDWDFDGDGEYDDASGIGVSYLATEPGVHTLVLRVTDDAGAIGTDEVIVTVRSYSPTADVGGPYIVDEGSSVILDASSSTDPGNDLVSYEWDLDNDGQYDDASGVTASFSQTDSGSYTVAVRVTNGRGLIDTASTMVTVNNVAPMADAGGPYMIDEGSSVVLSAAASADPGDDITSYEWDLNGDGQYDDASGITTDFSATDVGNHTVGLRVTDTDGASDTTTATVTVNNLTPTADAGGPYAVDEGASVTLDASGSTDPSNAIVSYEWDFDGDDQYDDASGVTVDFMSHDSGNHTVGLKVTDTHGAADTTTVTVTVNNVAPTADAGGPYTGDQDSSLTLDASGSIDPGNDIVSYEWDFDGDGQYDDASGEMVQFPTATPGTFTAVVKVTDADGEFAVSTTTVTVSEVVASEWGVVQLNLRDFDDTKDLEWMDEWGSCWVEVWASGSEAVGIGSFDVELDYMAGCFMPELVMTQAGENLDAGTFNVTLDPTTGHVHLTGNMSTIDAGQGSGVLLAKVAFTPTPGESVLPRDTDGKYLEPVADAGFQIVDAALTQSTSTMVSPATIIPHDPVPLWPVIYDLNGDSVINLRDIAKLLNVYRWNVGDGDNPTTWLADIDRDGTVDLRDLSYILTRFRWQKGDGGTLTYPQNFPFTTSEPEPVVQTLRLTATDQTLAATTTWPCTDFTAIAKDLATAQAKKSTIIDELFASDVDPYDDLD